MYKSTASQWEGTFSFKAEWILIFIAIFQQTEIKCLGEGWLYLILSQRHGMGWCIYSEEGV